MILGDIDLLPPDGDDGVDTEIMACLDPLNPRSFFLYAGAGSGKTRSLKRVLEMFRDRHGTEFRMDGRKVAVITYTNAAAEEIAHRVGKDPLFPISTIHSFCWAHIGSYHADMQRWLLANLPKDLADLEAKQAKGRSGSKAALDRERAIVEINRRIEWLAKPRRFTYNPNGDNFGADTLSHSEVLKITASFITEKPSMQEVLVNRYPFLMIDESQDTNKSLMEAFFVLASRKIGRFGLGLFGDTMQRIYLDGLANLGELVPREWGRPVKRINHRSSRRVIRLANSIRAAADQQMQAARSDSAEGVVRLFVAPADTNNHEMIELHACRRMAELTGDNQWLNVREAVKTLTLEHHMAAARGGFLPMFEALDKDSKLSAGLRKGELAGLRLFTERVAPLLVAAKAGDRFAVMEILRNTSPLLKAEVLASSSQQDDPLSIPRLAFQALTTIDIESPDTRFLEVLKAVAQSGIFEIPSALRPFVAQEESTEGPIDSEDEPLEELDTPESSSSSLRTWRAFLETPYRQIEAYAKHVREVGPFGTHQGVKGLEFDRVFVILDDSAARGFLFSYERLLGSNSDKAQGRWKDSEATDTSIDRTRRLLYVACTRAKETLALMVYATDSKSLIGSVIEQGWLDASEVEELSGDPA
jgi:DNA helicase-2/ATP-dependent DNA helicase PcrA